MQSNYLSLYTLFFSHSLFYAYFPYQRFFALWLILLSLPFNFKDRFARLRFALASQQAKKNISQNRSFCQAPFAFFILFFKFLHAPKLKAKLKNKDTSTILTTPYWTGKNQILLPFKTVFNIVDTHSKASTVVYTIEEIGKPKNFSFLLRRLTAGQQWGATGITVSYISSSCQHRLNLSIRNKIKKNTGRTDLDQG